MPKNKKEKKETYIDDGRTVAPMDAEWMPWNGGRASGIFGSSGGRKHKNNEKKRGDARGDGKNDSQSQNVTEAGDRGAYGRQRNRLELTRAEKRGMMLGALRAYAPLLGGLAAVTALMYVLARVWLG